MKTIVRLFVVLAATMLNASEAENPIEAELFPADFLLAQREPLGLTEEQLRAVQSAVGEVKPRFEELRGKLDGRVADLREALSLPKPEAAQAEEKLRILLADENEMKLLQLRLMLTLRDHLTPEQVTKARELRRQALPKAPPEAADAVRQRIIAKVESVKEGVQKWAAGGRDPSDMAKMMQEKVKPLLDAGKVGEAEAELDRLLEQLKQDGK